MPEFDTCDLNISFESGTKALVFSLCKIKRGVTLINGQHGKKTDTIRAKPAQTKALPEPLDRSHMTSLKCQGQGAMIIVEEADMGCSKVGLLGELHTDMPMTSILGNHVAYMTQDQTLPTL
jgi:hypothetical protein